MEYLSERLVEVTEDAIKQAKTVGVDSSYINARLSNVFSVRWANSAIHQHFKDFETRFSITVIIGLKRATVTINSLEEINWAVQQAARLVRHLPDDPDFPELLEHQKYPDLKLHDPETKNLTSFDIVDKVVSGINTGHEYSSKVKTVSGNMNYKDGTTLFVSSEGLEYLAPITGITTTMNIMAEDGSIESRSNSSFGGRNFSKLPFESETQEVAKRAVAGLKSTEIEAKTYPVILDYQAAADQMYFIGEALSAQMILDQKSFLKDKMGEKVFSENFTLKNDPHDPVFLGSQALD
ncbi:MAG: metallopeptidase TldD-related protein, partial [Candidatus Hodarchaeales archaeon]